jgi:hypothetical protein
MPYAEKAGIPHVGDRVRHLTGNVGTVIFVQRDAPKTQAREHIRVRWDNDSTEVAPHLANEYTLVSPQETSNQSAPVTDFYVDLNGIDVSLRSEVAAPRMVRGNGDRKMAKHEPQVMSCWDPVLDASQRQDEGQPFQVTQARDCPERSSEHLEWELTRWPEGAEL